ncbi:hypothetical protein H696_06249 [Fonticula alba]|uniref:Uncharacterized protein n=1 Tax=Fonticula alba TaxID=691883 RepID=A0A058YZA1_FONAL|nr:hypothetical protein H696_06249 [Fonticula alba]KCV67325.1 hypothetical protein H696_06249 [Fonticula alba]|eukprot:XP_009498269.1 hypothetical protein H696_06249 [Fonticula alba]
MRVPALRLQYAAGEAARRTADTWLAAGPRQPVLTCRVSLRLALTLLYHLEQAATCLRALLGRPQDAESLVDSFLLYGDA